MPRAIALAAALWAPAALGGAMYELPRPDDDSRVRARIECGGEDCTVRTLCREPRHWPDTAVPDDFGAEVPVGALRLAWTPWESDPALACALYVEGEAAVAGVVEHRLAVGVVSNETVPLVRVGPFADGPPSGIQPGWAPCRPATEVFACPDVEHLDGRCTREAPWHAFIQGHGFDAELIPRIAREGVWEGEQLHLEYGASVGAFDQGYFTSWRAEKGVGQPSAGAAREFTYRAPRVAGDGTDSIKLTIRTLDGRCASTTVVFPVLED